MGQLVEGIWRGEGHDAPSRDGRFVRAETQFRNWVTPDGSPGPTGAGGFRAEPGRYHLYVSLACPWAHRTLIMRRLKGLEDAIDVSVVHWHMAEHGWEFRSGPGATGDHLFGLDYLYQVYTRARPDYTGRVSVPVLWDKERETIVNNESAEIIRMFNSAFDRVGATGPDYYPEPLRAEIDALNHQVFEHVNNGVYRASAISRATASPRPISACSPRSCASMRSTSATSSAISGAWSITRACGRMRASCTSTRVSPRPSTSSTSSTTTTRAMRA
jgi:glutathionyl-hydroquinone reductase